MFKRIVLFALGIALFAVLGAFILRGFSQPASPAAAPTTSASLLGADVAADARWYTYVIPTANLGEVLKRSESRQARAVEETARVQAVIDHIKTHGRFPLRTRPFDSAQQVVMDYIRINQRIPSSAGHVDAPVKAVLDYIRTNHAMPPHPAPVDPAVQAVMDYIRIYGKVPTSAGAVQ